MFRFPSVICTRCTGFFCFAIIKGPPNDIYCIIEEPSKHYFTEKVSHTHIFLKIVIGVVLACILFVCFLYTNNEIGVTSSKLEADIRSSQKIKDDWTVDGSVSSTMAAYISYPQDLSDHSFSVYVNRPGLSFGYFFRGGGTLSGIQRGIVEFTVEGYNERAFISMNQQQVQQLEIDDGNTIQVVDIDRNKPFAIVLPINAGNITFYDVNRNTVEYWNNPL